MTPRATHSDDIAPLAQLWFNAWHETQAPHVPDGLIALRTLESFAIRLARMGDLLRAAGPVGAPIGFCAIKAGELHQLFVAPAARGTGIAAALLGDAEQRLVALGHTSARLECLIENEAARRFYRRNGWIEKGVETALLDTLDGPFALPCMIFSKALTP